MKKDVGRKKQSLILISTVREIFSCFPSSMSHEHMMSFWDGPAETLKPHGDP